MGKNKLRKFAEVEAMPHVMQFPFGRLATEGFPLKGRWREDFFHNENPIVLELGCGRGEYTVGLARRFPDRNFIGVDIKGARIWAGAKESMQSGMTNVAFLRTNIEILPQFFSSGEVSEIWITFPDPQMKKVRKRLTSATFLDIYRRILCDDGIINLEDRQPVPLHIHLPPCASQRLENHCRDRRPVPHPWNPIRHSRHSHSL